MARAIAAHWGQLDLVAAKAALLFLVALVGLRLSARRTVAELSVFDFVTAVAVGAVVGRVPNASTTSFAAGAVTLAVLLVMHHLIGRVRVGTRWGRLLDHRPVPLVQEGEVDHRALRRRQLSRDDLASLLRARGISDLSEADCVVFEPGGNVSILRSGNPPGDLFRDVAETAQRAGRRTVSSSASTEA